MSEDDVTLDFLLEQIAKLSAHGRSVIPQIKADLKGELDRRIAFDRDPVYLCHRCGRRVWLAVTGHVLSDHTMKDHRQARDYPEGWRCDGSGQEPLSDSGPLWSINGEWINLLKPAGQPQPTPDPTCRVLIPAGEVSSGLSWCPYDECYFRGHCAFCGHPATPRPDEDVDRGGFQEHPEDDLMGDEAYKAPGW